MNIKTKKSIFSILAAILCLLVAISALLTLGYITKTNEPDIPVANDTIVLMPVKGLNTKPTQVQLNKPVDAIGRIEVFDKHTKWEQWTSVNLFHDKQNDRDTIVAPYSYGEYTYNIKNYFNQNMVYSMKFSIDNYYEIPLKFKVSDQNGHYIVGSEYEYVTLDDTRSMNYDIRSNSMMTYKIEWFWDTESDEKDTYLGLATTEKVVQYDMDINIFAEIDGAPTTGDNTDIMLLLVVVLCAAAAMGVSLYMRRKQ